MIEKRDDLARTPAHEVALDCLDAAIRAAAPATATRSNLALEGDTLTIDDRQYDLHDYDDVLVVGGGKAAGGVVSALESVLGDRITDGLVVATEPAQSSHVRAVVGDHPLPSERNAAASGEILELVRDADEATLVLAVVTGGGSSLLTAPREELDVPTLRETTDRLLDGGVPIQEINSVRKHLSRIKGGQLAAAATPATTVGLLVSDVVGDDPSTIASGPTVPDETTFADARAVFDRFGVEPPSSVRELLERGEDGDVAETPSAAHPAFSRTDTHLVGDNTAALDAARDAATAAGYVPLILTSRARGEAREIAKQLVATAEETVASGNPASPPAVLLAGGECTVTVRGDGQGGPNQELALSAALELESQAVVAAIDSDGEDGSTDVAGAIVDADTIVDSSAARAALDENDVTPLLDSLGVTIRTGPTGTNVNDIHVVVVPDFKS